MTPKTKRFAAVAALSLITLMSLSAHGAGTTLVITDAGYQVMSVGADGKAVLTDVGTVVDLRGNAPGPVPPTPPGDTDPIASKVKAWSAEVGDPAGAQALAIAYREVGKISAGQSRENVMNALRMSSDAVLSKTGSAEKWNPWRAKVGGLIDSEEAKGPVDWPKFCNSVANGLEAGAPSPALDPILLQAIIQAVLQIIQLIFNLTGGGIGGV